MKGFLKIGLSITLGVWLTGCSESGGEVTGDSAVDEIDRFTPGEVSQMNHQEISVAMPSFKQQVIKVRAHSGSKTSIGMILGLDDNSFTTGGEYFSTVPDGCINYWLDTSLNHSQTELVFETLDQFEYSIGCDFNPQVVLSQPAYDSEGLYIGQAAVVPAMLWFSVEQMFELKRIAVTIDAGYTELATSYDWLNFSHIE